MAELSRRSFLALGATIAVGACSSGEGSTSRTSPATTTTSSAPPLPANPFTLGVSSGDPDDRSAVLWTRLTGDRLPDVVELTWELADDASFGATTASGTIEAALADGHSVHATVPLEGPAWFRFRVGDWTSPVGRAASTPAGTAAELRLATASCQHWETGFYAAHRDIAEWSPDLVVFLGDFIYENPGRPVGDNRVRSHDGGEPADLAAYRARYAQYLSDLDLQAARAASPWLVVWDDHEVENNYAGLVPQDAANAAGFAARRAAAYRAWWEHMPVRLPKPGDGDFPMHRAVRWGDLADLVLLDGRQFRSDQACAELPPLSSQPACPQALDPARTMLGGEQEAWLGEVLAGATGTWTVIGQQTVLTDLRLGAAVLNYDQWDGYAPARDRLLAQAAATDRLIVLTGDIHLAGVGQLPGVGVEFVTTSISSRGDVPAELQPILDSFPAVVASELVHRGYTRHTVTPSMWTAEYRIVDDVLNPASPVFPWRTFRVDATTRDLPVAE